MVIDIIISSASCRRITLCEAKGARTLTRQRGTSLGEVMMVILVIAITAMIFGLVVKNARQTLRARTQMENNEVFNVSKAVDYSANRMWEVENIQRELGGYYNVTLRIAGTGNKPDGTSMYLFQEFPFRVGDYLVAYSDDDGNIELFKVGTVDEVSRAVPLKPLDGSSTSQESSPVAVEASSQGGEH